MISIGMLLPSALALVWAGVSLGGALVAAPAKFQAPSLTLPVALEVGRAQFKWIGWCEAALCGLLVLALVWSDSGSWQIMLVPIGLFALQRLVIMPPLDARTLKVIAGAEQGKTSLHIFYIIAECSKFLALLAAAYIFIQS